MAFVITGGCCSDATCVDVCPVDCIRPTPADAAFKTAAQLFIDPSACIGCSACMYACPVSAIYDEPDMPPELQDFAAVNREFFDANPLEPRFEDGPPVQPAASQPARIAIIGSGPSACYAAAELSAMDGVEVTLFERLPTPFGLVRSGVAPDHPRTKLISDLFQSILERPNVSCLFNVDVGSHITLQEILATHHAAIYAGGADDDKRLGIEGEDLTGSVAAREVVAWYNGHPEFVHNAPPLHGRTAVVLGNGNVALDVARILARPPADHLATEMADHAVVALAASAIDEVVIVARRGPEDAACTLPELLELTRLAGVHVEAVPAETAVGDDSRWTPSQRRKAEVFRTMTDDSWLREGSARRITFRFGWEPVSISGAEVAESITLRKTVGGQDTFTTVETGLVVRAVGYRTSDAAGFPVDALSGTVPNAEGRVIDENGTHIPGLYVVGWAKRGASGVIGTNKECARETIALLMADLDRRDTIATRLEGTPVRQILSTRQPEFITADGWRAIDQTECEGGRTSEIPRPRRKITDKALMLRIAQSAQGERDG